MRDMTPITPTAYALMLHGAKTFADIEQRGFCVDTEYIPQAEEKLNAESKALMAKLEATRLWQTWLRRYGALASVTSGPQLSNILFDVLGHSSGKSTKRGGTALDEEALSMVNEDGIEELIGIKQRQKAVGTYLRGLKSLTVNGRVYPFYNLHTTVTFRSSSSDPNFQNVPIRHPEIGPTIRKAIIAPPGFHLMECDCTGAEVRTGACYHEDESMVAYITDPTKDMHRDAAMDIFGLKLDQMAKPIRQGVKGDWVFAQFYGSIYKNCAAKIWRKMLDVVAGDGITLRAHLAAQGISTYEQFEDRCRQAEDEFWNVRFKGYTKWKQKRWQEYLRNGYFDTLTGFRCQGYMSRNAVGNYPIQGSAFHVLLRLVIDCNIWLKKEAMKSHIVGQVHDSMLTYLHEDETTKVFTWIKEWYHNLSKSWKWVIVPLDYEVEMSQPGGSWADKQAVKGA